VSTYQPIASVTLSSAQSSVTFSGIPQTYTDLVVVINGGLSATTSAYVRFNSDSGTNYSRTALYGDGSSAGSNRGSNDTYFEAFYIGTDNSTSILQVMNYSNTTTNKTALSRNNGGGYVSARVGLWRNTSAITSILLAPSSGNFASGATFNLYGVANASITNVAKATGGDSVYTDGTYWYHIFRSSGTFTPTQALTADYLVVAGGGGAGGGDGGGGGGGAGGFRTSIGGSGLSCTASTNYTVTIGAGGAGGATRSNGVKGSNSVFSTITSTGGGYGGAYGNPTGTNGGSGGSGGGGGTSNGGSTTSGGTGNEGSYSPAEGTNGGNGFVAGSSYGGGGGGGATSAGAAATNSAGGNGGAGTASSITGTSVTYAGGGGGGAFNTAGTGGSGGGGNGVVNGNGVAASANTGGGGGGGGTTGGSTGGAGGSGIVIVRYSAA